MPGVTWQNGQVTPVSVCHIYVTVDEQDNRTGFSDEYVHLYDVENGSLREPMQD